MIFRACVGIYEEATYPLWVSVTNNIYEPGSEDGSYYCTLLVCPGYGRRYDKRWHHARQNVREKR